MRWRVLFIILLLTAVPSGAQIRHRIRLAGVLSYEQTVPVFVALAHGFYEEESLEITRLVFGTAAPLRAAMMAREFDVGYFAFLRKAGLDPEWDVRMLATGSDPGVIYSAIRTGRVDAYPTWEPTTTRVLLEGLVYALVRA